MSVEFKGQSPDVVRVMSGLWSLDHTALGFQGQYGMPLRSLYEIYGRPGSGKSSLAYYLAGRVRSPGRVLIADLEANLDKKYVVEAVTRSGFSGTVQSVDYKDPKDKPRSHERMIQDLADAILEEDDVTAGILDSLGMLTPIPEQAKDLGESTMGVRAKVTADFSRRTANKLLLCPEPKAMFVVNHVHDPIGGRGHITPGGETLKYMSNVRLWLYRLETLKDGSFCTEAKVEKLKYGGVHTTRKGLVFIIPGYGVSPEMTAVFDCINLGLAERSTTVKMDVLDTKTGKFKSRSMGYLEKNLVVWAKEGKKFQFDPFYEALSKYDAGETVNAEEGDDEEEETEKKPKTKAKKKGKR